MRASSVAFVMAFFASLLPVMLIEFVLIFVIALQLFIGGVHLIARLYKTLKSPENKSVHEPIILSVHLATHNEPPDLVIETLRALIANSYDQNLFEIIILDNNTCDLALWKPVQKWCEDQSNCYFYHEGGVSGAKAGALNIALQRTRADATHIVTIDADYVVEPNFLEHAAAAVLRTGDDFVQFPQAYRHTTNHASGINLELSDYFLSHARSANTGDAMLLTGTLSVISRKALACVGGWPTSSTTEDADLGIRLREAGFSGRYVDKIVGHGLLPLSIDGLSKQRHRWTSGNISTLLQHVTDRASGFNSLGAKRKLLVFSQLTAWISLSLVPAAILTGSLLLSNDAGSVTILASIAVIFSFVRILLSLAATSLIQNEGFGTFFKACVSRIALLPASARGTVDAICSKKLQFIVTPKSNVKNAYLPFFDHFAIFALSAFCLIFFTPANLVIVVGLISMLMLLPAALITEVSLRSYRKLVHL